MDDNNKQIAFVTGASSGIGKAIAQIMAKDGYIVFGTSRSANYEKVKTDDVSYTMLPMTLEDEVSISDAVAHIIDKHGRIDVVVNAAGSGIAGAIEETSSAEAKAQFDVCFFGVVSVLEVVLPHMRAVKSGMIINIGSMASCFPIPFQAMYSAVKSALLMMTAAFRMEVRPFGIKACVIEPGDTKTGFTQRRVYAKKTRNTAYKKPFERALYEMIRSELAAYGPEKCAKLVLKTAKMKNPPIRQSVGFENKLFYVLAKILPLTVREKIISLIYLKNDPPDGAVWTFEKQFKEKN